MPRALLKKVRSRKALTMVTESLLRSWVFPLIFAQKELNQVLHSRKKGQNLVRSVRK